jgi:plastocyanin
VVAACRSSSDGGSKPDGGTSSIGPTSIEISETDAGFEPTAITIHRSQVVDVTFANRGKDIHNLRIAGGAQFASSGDLVLGNPVVQPGQSATSTWRAPDQPGTRRFRCDVHPTHTGVITIQ